MDVDDTLVLILERIDSPVGLRTASTCRRWRRVIADAGFLRRFRSLHGPPVAGDYNNGPRGCNTVAGHPPIFVPSSTIDAHHFSLDFLIDASIFPPRDSPWYTSSWQVRDSHGSLLLMEYTHATDMSGPYPDLVVCEPRTRRYKVIPQPLDFDSAIFMFEGPYLINGGEDAAGGRISMSNFRVLCVLFSHAHDDVAHTTVFTAGSGDMDSTWSEMAIDHIASRVYYTSIATCYLGRVLGSSYYYVDQMLIIHDHSTGKYSSYGLSRAIINCWDRHIWWTGRFSVEDGGDSEPRIVTMMDHTMEVFARVDGDGEWVLDNKVLLSKVTCGLPGYRSSFFNKPLTIMKRGVGFLVMSPQEPKQQWPISINLKTMEVAPAADGTKGKMAYPCEFPWPPVLKACLD